MEGEEEGEGEEERRSVDEGEASFVQLREMLKTEREQKVLIASVSFCFLEPGNDASASLGVLTIQGT